MTVNKNIKAEPQEMNFGQRLLKHLLLFTLLSVLMFAVAYLVDYSVEYIVYEELADGGSGSITSRMPVPAEVLLIVFSFMWLAGAATIIWYDWSQYQKARSLAADRSDPELLIKEQLQKTIRTRYQMQFWGSMTLYTVVMAMVAAMIYVVQESRIWYATDPLYPLLKTLKNISPYAAAAIWIGGAALLLFHYWKRSASDTVGLIDSIKQMQNDQEHIDISVPDNLIEIKPVLQEMLDKSQKDRQAAKAAEQRKNELIAFLAHDLKTPLTSVIGYLSLLMESPEMPDEQRDEYSKIALDKALRLESLINQLFEISRFNLDEMVLDKEEFDLKYLLLQLTDEFYPVLEPQKKTIDLKIPDELKVKADAGKLARVFNNILRNAVAYSLPESVITIEAFQDDKHTSVAFMNQGNTIPEDQLKTIFNKFYRLDEARASDTGGAGLGLAIAQEIVQLHNGKIEAKSADQTVTFAVTLPHIKS